MFLVLLSEKEDILGKGRILRLRRSEGNKQASHDGGGMETMAVMKSKMNAHPFSNLDTEHLLHQPFRGMDPSQ